jgi:uncharacterized protein
MQLLGWIFRILLILFIIRLVLRFLAGAMRPSAPPPPRAPRTPPTIEGGQLVRDPHCGTYIPISRALRSGPASDPVYFCSAACRDAWASGKAG